MSANVTLAPRLHFIAAVPHTPSLTSQRRINWTPNWTPLRYAIQHGDKFNPSFKDVALAQYLRSVGAHMSMYEAAFFGDVALVRKYLLANPACINEKCQCAPPMQLMFMSLLVCPCAASTLSSTAIIALP